MKNKFSMAMSLAVILAMLLTAVALADDVVIDGDIVSSGNQSSVDLGTVAPGAELTPQVSFALVCSTKNHVDNNQTLTLSFSLDDSTVPADGGLSASDASIGPIPSNWPDDATSGGGSTNCGSPAPAPLNDTGNSNVTITAPTIPGPHTFVVRYTFGADSLTPPGNNDNSAVQSNHVDVTYTLTVEDTAADTDGDGVADDEDNCPLVSNADQLDTDGDGDGNACDADDDGDGYSDDDEIAAGSDPLNSLSTREVCDGADNDLDTFVDEGFTDSDGDGIANCVDPNAFAPTITTAAADANGNEGDTLAASGAFADGDNDMLTITKFSGVGDITDNSDGTWSWSLATTDNGSGAVTVQAYDGEHTTTDSFNWSAANVNPVANAGADESGFEGSPVSFTFSCSDLGTADTWTASVDWGDSSSQSLGTVTCNSGTFGASHTYDDNGNYTVTLSVVDDDLGSGSDTASASIANVAPTVTLSGANTANEGAIVSYSYSFNDPGADTWTHSASCGGGTLSNDVFNSSTKSGSFDCTFPDDDGSPYAVSVTIDDDDGGSDTDTINVAVSNVAPTIQSVTAGSAASCGGNNSITVNFSDPGADTFTATINWGDGNTDSLTSVTSPFGASHIYALAGPHTVTVTVADDDGGVSDPVTATVTVNYNLTGILQPVNPGPPNSIFKYGSTIPVKVRVTDCDGSYPGNLELRVTWQLLSGGTPTGEVSEPYSTSAADSGNTMRFTGAPDNQYIFNLASRSFPDGTASYRIFVTIQSTGQQVYANIGLKLR